MQSILLVDDDADYLRQFRNFLTREGFAVRCAENGETALSILKDESIMIMITDLNMPGIDGIDLARKALKTTPHLPVILCTGDVSSEVVVEAAKAGIAKVIGKLFSLEKLLQLIRQLTTERSGAISPL